MPNKSSIIMAVFNLIFGKYYEHEVRRIES